MAGWRCPECGVDFDTIAPGDLAVAIRSYPRRFAALLTAVDEDDAERLRSRPEPSTWSATEYTAHVADIFDAFAEIVRRMRTEDHPSLTLWDPDERARQQDYAAAGREDVLGRLDRAAQVLADAAAAVSGKEWGRTATFPWGDRDLLTMGRNAVHEGRHHLRDVERVLERVGR